MTLKLKKNVLEVFCEVKEIQRLKSSEAHHLVVATSLNLGDKILKHVKKKAMAHYLK
jgi:hypothetical protein